MIQKLRNPAAVPRLKFDPFATRDPIPIAHKIPTQKLDKTLFIYASPLFFILFKELFNFQTPTVIH